MLDSSSEKGPTSTEQAEAPIPANVAPETVKQLTRILERQGLDRAKAEVVVQEVKTEIIRAHAGPLPSVETFAGYEEVCPGSAREILDMAVRQQKHRHHIESYAASSEFWLPVIGIGAAVSIVATMFVAGVYLAMNGHENLAIGVLSGTGIVTVVGAFLQRGKADEAKPAAEPQERSRHMSRRERRERSSQVRKNIINH